MASPGRYAAVLLLSVTVTIAGATACAARDRSLRPAVAKPSPSVSRDAGSPRDQFRPLPAATISPLPPEMAAEMTSVSWRPGCPVPLSSLRLLRIPYWGFDGTPHLGE